MTVHVPAPLSNPFSSWALGISSGAVNHLWLCPQWAGPGLGTATKLGDVRGSSWAGGWYLTGRCSWTVIPLAAASATELLIPPVLDQDGADGTCVHGSSGGLVALQSKPLLGRRLEEGWVRAKCVSCPRSAPSPSNALAKPLPP